jgi:hypothetical protein
MSSESPNRPPEDEPSGPPPEAEEDLPYAQPIKAPADPAETAARSRVRLASAALIMVGALNLVLAFPLLIGGVISLFWTRQDAETAAREMEAMQASMLKLSPGTPLEPVPDPDELKTQNTLRGLSWGLLDLTSSLLTIIGGIRMRVLRNLRLVIAGALVAALPFVSCGACCGVGEIVGGWALLVLLDPGVRRAFR